VGPHKAQGESDISLVNGGTTATFPTSEAVPSDRELKLAGEGERGGEKGERWRAPFCRGYKPDRFRNSIAAESRGRRRHAFQTASSLREAPNVLVRVTARLKIHRRFRVQPAPPIVIRASALDNRIRFPHLGTPTFPENSRPPSSPGRDRHRTVKGSERERKREARRRRESKRNRQKGDSSSLAGFSCREINGRRRPFDSSLKT